MTVIQGLAGQAVSKPVLCEEGMVHPLFLSVFHAVFSGLMDRDG